MDAVVLRFFIHIQLITEPQNLVKYDLKEEEREENEFKKWFHVDVPMNIYYLYNKEQFCQGKLCPQLRIANREYGFK